MKQKTIDVVEHEPLEVSTIVDSDDCKLLVEIWNQGIDARLEGFTKSMYTVRESNPPWPVRLELRVHPDEIQILIRRLLDYGTEEADRWADDIVRIWYAVKPLE